MRPSAWVKWVGVAAVVAVVVTASYVVEHTHLGHAIQSNADTVRTWVGKRPVSTPMLFLAGYVLVSVLALPVWWLQVLAGVCWGLWGGGSICVLGSTIGSTLGAQASRYFAGDVVHDQIEARLTRLRKLDDLFGSNGLLVVMTIRLTHFTPFGLSNYFFGLTRISLRDVAIGTMLGNIPAIAVYVGTGAGYRPLQSVKFIAAVLAVNVVLLIPLVFRYLFPKWFRRIGIE